MIWLQLITTTKYQRMNTQQPMKTKKQIYLQIKIHNKHLKNNTVVDNCYIELCLKYEKYS